MLPVALAEGKTGERIVTQCKGVLPSARALRVFSGTAELLGPRVCHQFEYNL
jgi:hypothetical protein